MLQQFGELPLELPKLRELLLKGSLLCLEQDQSCSGMVGRGFWMGLGDGFSMFLDRAQEGAFHGELSALGVHVPLAPLLELASSEQLESLFRTPATTLKVPRNRPSSNNP